MPSQNIVLAATRTFIGETVGDVITFPLWWYTKGLQHIARNRAVNIRETTRNLALRILLLNMFRPMFGQYDRVGRIISFFMRVVILIARGAYLTVYIVLQLVILLLWIIAPIYILWRVITIGALGYVGL